MKLTIKKSIEKIGKLFLYSPSITFASGFGFGDDNFSLINALNQLIDLLTSQIGGAVCVLSIVSVGYAWLKMGRIEKGPAVVSIVGVSVIFSAAWIAKYLGFIS